VLIRRHADTLSFVRSLELHYSVRFHAAVLLVAATSAGLLVSWLLRTIGMEAPWLRFPIAVLAGYLLFLWFVDLWLAYIGLKRNPADGDISLDGPLEYSGGAGGEGCAVEPVSAFRGEGGTFDGGGANASFDVGSAKAEAGMRAKSAAVHAGFESKVNAGLAVDDAVGAAAGAAEFFPIAVLVLVVGVIFAAVGWTVTMTPMLLVETAVEVAVASGLIRSTGKWRGSRWLDTLLDRTVWKAAGLAVAALALGVLVRRVDPTADTLGQAVAHWMAR
jgi:uncharacterized membrane protein YecN with MAPEG domain